MTAVIEEPACWVPAIGSTIEAVEVYLNASDAPMEMQQPGQRCGVIAVWTRRQP